MNNNTRTIPNFKESVYNKTETSFAGGGASIDSIMFVLISDMIMKNNRA